MFRQFRLLFNVASDGTEGGGGAPDLTASPPENKVIPPANDPPPSIWGDMKVEFPEGFDDTLKNEGSLKAFVKDGKFNYANVLKSYIHAQKAMGKEKVAIPKESSTEAEWNEFHKKVFGYSEDLNDYKLTKDEKSLVDDEFFTKFKKFAHETKIPTSMAQKALSFIENVSKEEQSSALKARQEYEAQGVENMKKDWGEAYGRKVAAAQRLIKEFGDESLINHLKENNLATDPTLIRFLSGVGEKLFREGSVRRGADGLPEGALTPEEIDKEINDIRGNKAHAFNNPNHPGYQAAQKEMLKLYERKRNAQFSNSSGF